MLILFILKRIVLVLIYTDNFFFYLQQKSSENGQREIGDSSNSNVPSPHFYGPNSSSASSKNPVDGLSSNDGLSRSKTPTNVDHNHSSEAAFTGKTPILVVDG